MVVLEAIGLASKEVFDYNRENFSFDNEQRLDKEKTRLVMQCERFSLFREDIQDLVNLTVNKMDMYHAVAALLLGSSATLYTEGRMHASGNTPPWYIGIYFISIAASFVYLLLAVWLSMYASVASHSFGVRLRTRYVRLPIPSLAQINALTTRFENFEKQGAAKIMRIPFGPQGAPQWQLEADLSAQRQAQYVHKVGGGPVSTGAASSSKGGGASSSAGQTHVGALGDWLGAGEAAFGKHEIVERAAMGQGQHVKLFRRLQSKWQCYDAYARVSMSLGINQLLQTLTYYLLGACLIENCMTSAAIALTLIYQASALALSFLDIAGVSKRKILGIQVLGTTPPVIVLVSLAVAERDESGLVKGTNRYYATPAAFFVMVLWYEALLWAARPSDDDATLPRRFRSVLFLDVFGDASYDPTEAERVLPAANTRRHAKRRQRQETQAAAAERHVVAALAALRRWEAVPPQLLSDADRAHLKKHAKDFNIWRKAFHGHIVQQKGKRGVPHYDLSWVEEEGSRSWGELTSVEQEHEPFADSLLGPLHDKGHSFHYDLEAGQCVYEELPGRAVLSLREVGNLVRRLEDAVQSVLAKTDAEADQPGDGDGDESPATDGEPEIPRERSGLPTRVERLPWKTVRRMTRVFQICLLFLGIMDILYILGYSFDTVRWDKTGQLSDLMGEPATHTTGTTAGSHTWENQATSSGGTHAEIPSQGEHAAASPSEAGHEVATSGGEVAEQGHDAAAAEGNAPEGGVGAAEGAPGGAAADGHQATGLDHERRLGTIGGRVAPPSWRLAFARLAVAWPHGKFFRPAALTCSLETTGAPSSIFISSPFMLYRAKDRSNPPLQMEALPRPAFAPGGPEVVFCGPEFEEPAPCLLGSLVPEGLSLRPAGDRLDIPADTVTLPIRGQAWQMMAGAVVHCDKVAGWRVQPGQETWCLLLAGWDGQKLPIAVVPLGVGSTKLPPPSHNLTSRFDAPLLGAREPCRGKTDARADGPGSTCEGGKPHGEDGGQGAVVIALHVEQQSGRLWALLESGELQAWDLPAARSLGRWQPHWPGGIGEVRATAVCEDSGRGLLVAGFSEASGPELFRARLPRALAARAGGGLPPKAADALATGPARIRPLFAS